MRRRPPRPRDEARVEVDRNACENEQAIATAREGFYTRSRVADVSEERLQRFFEREPAGYRVRRELREMMLFAHHNVIKDPPFSHLDLISCRNLLIYLNRAIQERVLETFHFALRPGGILFLGTSEIAGRHQRSVRRRRQARARLREPDGHQPAGAAAAGVTRVRRRASAARQRRDYGGPTASRPPICTSGCSSSTRRRRSSSPTSTTSSTCRSAADAYLQIARRRAVARSAAADPAGAARRPAHARCIRPPRQRASVEVRNVRRRAGADGDRRVNIIVRPVLRDDDPARGFFLVLFEKPTAAGGCRRSASLVSVQRRSADHRSSRTSCARQGAAARRPSSSTRRRSRKRRRRNEELQAMNEELRSAAEELETSKEELQSVNEELTTVNQELKIKIEELGLTNNDFQNLINSTDIGTIFLDRALAREAVDAAGAGDLQPAPTRHRPAALGHHQHACSTTTCTTTCAGPRAAAERRARGRDHATGAGT